MTRCRLAREWLGWSSVKREDRQFMSCPGCGAYGSHVGQLDTLSPFTRRAIARELPASDRTAGR